MGNSPLRNGSVSAGVDCKSYLCSPIRGASCVQLEKYTSDFEEKSTKTNPLEDLEISSSEEDDDLEHLVVQELGVSLFEILRIHDKLEPLHVGNLEPLHVGNPALDEDENLNHQDTSLLSDTAKLEGLNENAIVLHSNVAQPYPSILDVVEELPGNAVHGDNFAMETTASACSLPAKKLISALKGSREKQGKHPSTKLSVKWAPEVYDPPVTSSSRMVKGRHHHNGHKTKKDYYMHKYTKGKTSHASGKKYAQRSRSSSSIIDPRISRLQGPNGCDGSKMEPSEHAAWRSPENGSKMEPSEHAAWRSPENGSKMEPSERAAWRSPENITICGSRCHLESAAPVPLPIAQ